MEHFLFTFVILIQSLNINCKDIVISTPVGDILGQTSSVHFSGHEHTVSSFLGIPFAESTHGSRRFSKPVKKAKFEQTFNASEAKLSCPQNVKWAAGLEEVPVGEDCLNLNILLPGKIHVGDKKAVMIFIYGGVFQYGFQNAYMSTALAVLHDVIYVSFNYRVSAYGFLASKQHGLKGNYGLWDQHMAIQWVHDNIASFGGDPERVTLFGQSAGAASVIYQALYEGNKGLIRRIIAQSGTVGAFWSLDKNPDYLFNDLSNKSDCKKRTFAEVMRCLREIDIETWEKVIKFEADFLPVRDDDFIKYNPEDLFLNNSMESAIALQNFADVDMMVGLNSDEGLTELKSLSKLLRNDFEAFSDGMSKQEVRKYTDKVFRNMNETYDSAIINSVLHLYTDWSSENEAISRRAMFIDFLTDVYYTTKTVQTADAHFNTGSSKNTYMYYFDYKPSFSLSPAWIEGADHSEEIPFVLGFPRFYMYLFRIYKPDPAIDMPANELMLSAIVMTYWTQFAKTGNPNDPTDHALSMWPPYTTTSQTYLVLTADKHPLPTGNHFRNEFVSYWTEVFPALVKLSESTNTSPTKTYPLTSRNGSPSSITAELLIVLVSLLLFVG